MLNISNFHYLCCYKNKINPLFLNFNYRQCGEWKHCQSACNDLWAVCKGKEGK